MKQDMKPGSNLISQTFKTKLPKLSMEAKALIWILHTQGLLPNQQQTRELQM